MSSSNFFPVTQTYFPMCSPFSLVYVRGFYNRSRAELVPRFLFSFLSLSKWHRSPFTHLFRLQTSVCNHDSLLKFLSTSNPSAVCMSTNVMNLTISQHPLHCHFLLSHYHLLTTTVLQVEFSEKQTLRQTLVCRIFIRKYPWVEYLGRAG